MKLEELVEMVVRSCCRDWHTITTWGAGSGPSYRFQFESSSGVAGQHLAVDSHSMVAVFKEEVALTLAWGLVSNEGFDEDWVHSFADKHATSSFLDVFWGGSLVYRELYVTVDGGRVHLPLPDKHDGVLTAPESYCALVKLIQDLEGAGYDFDEYLERAKIKRTKVSWPTF